MELQSLNAEVREGVGKGPARQTRFAGCIPAVLYGGGQEPVSLRLNLREFGKIVQSKAGEHAIVQLQIPDHGEISCPALIKAIQRHPVRDHIMHADFQRIRLDERIATMIPVEISGQARGIVEGGVMEHQLREVEVECLALEVPEKILVDVSGLGLGDGLHASQLVLPEGMTLLTDPDRTVVSIHAPRSLRVAGTDDEEPEAEAAAPAAKA